MDIKKFVNVYTLAGAGAGYYVGNSKYGKKHGYKAGVGGAAVGVLAGLLVERVLAPKPTAAPQIAAQQPQQAAPVSEYVDLDTGLGEYVAPPQTGASAQQRAEYEAAQAASETLGSLSGGDGLGSLSGAPGFNADSIDYGDLGLDDEPGFN